MADRSKKQSRTTTKKNALDIINGNDALLILKALANEDRSMFFARVNSLFLQEFQTTFRPGNLSMNFH